jgi:uncharacterized protein YuzE
MMLGWSSLCSQVLLIEMKLSFDQRHNIAYIRLADAPSQVETIRVIDELNVDLTPDGKVYGFEPLNANEQLQGLAAGHLLVENEQTGRSVEVSLP